MFIATLLSQFVLYYLKLDFNDKPFKLKYNSRWNLTLINLYLLLINPNCIDYNGYSIILEKI